MVLKRRSLTSILEENRNNNEPEEAAPLPQTSQHVQLQTVQTSAAQPPASAAAAEDWGELLIKLLASAPEDVAQRLISCIDREVIAKVLERRNDPYLKVALLLISKK